ncbi:hypothetical protein J6590_013400 [Homalodisca vitripennis]|nr:hypothetical protein J6590_013400 [Homalodisca vitripennis]
MESKDIRFKRNLNFKNLNELFEAKTLTLVTPHFTKLHILEIFSLSAVTTGCPNVPAAAEAQKDQPKFSSAVGLMSEQQLPARADTPAHP